MIKSSEGTNFDSYLDRFPRRPWKWKRNNKSKMQGEPILPVEEEKVLLFRKLSRKEVLLPGRSKRSKKKKALYRHLKINPFHRENFPDQKKRRRSPGEDNLDHPVGRMQLRKKKRVNFDFGESEIQKVTSLGEMKKIN